MFRTWDNAELFEHRWDVDAGARGSVVILHGYGHHGGSFQEVASRLNAAGYSVFAFDQRGHGRSPGRRGYVAAFDHTLRDVDAYFGHIRPVIGHAPLFAMGHSLGGLILARCAIADQALVRGLIFSSALLKIPDRVSPLLQKIAGILGAVAPGLPIERVDFEAVSRDPAALQAMHADPLRYMGSMHARTGAEIARAVHALQSEMERMTQPMLILHGTADRLTDCDGSRQLYARARSADKTLSLFEGGYHELYNDLDKGRFLSEIAAWLDARA